MNVLTQILYLVGSGASAYIMARNIADPQTRPNLLAGFQMAESGAVPFLSALGDRAAAEGDDWLAERLAKHASDERRHGQIFAHGLKQMNKQIIDVEKAHQEEAAKPPAERRRSPFFEAYYRGYEAADLKPDRIAWDVFLGSTHILELDACKDLTLMAKALPLNDPRNETLQKGILSIAQDEAGHAAYLKEAMLRRYDYATVERLIDDWRTRKVDALLAMSIDMLQRGGKMSAMARDGAPSEMLEEQAPATETLAA
ncbi:MAG: ferritin-like domain-containing protein [Synechococcales bacterium]|nr:ferritin-like domain-containing protein [Synechococcales bacterium]